MSEAVEVTAEMYARVFEGHHEGQLILADLTRRFFDQPVYRPGGLEAQRETERRAAQREVLSYILLKIGQVSDVKADEE